MTTPETSIRPVVIWLVIVAFLITLMVGVGGVTRLTGSGLSMVDWRPIMGAVPPLTDEAWAETFAAYQAFPEYRLRNEGMTVPEFQRIFTMEYLHRLLGRIIGIAFLLPFIAFLAMRTIRGKLAWKLAGVFVLGGLQGLLGWYMVKSGLVDKPYVSHYRLTAHLGLAFALFGYIVWLVMGLVPEAPAAAPLPPRRGWRTASILFGLLLVFQVVFGALVAGLRAGLSFNTFPTMMGYWAPPGMLSMEPVLMNLVENPITVQFAHRALAWLLAAAAASMWIAAVRSRISLRQRASVNLVCAFVAVQFFLGVVTLLLKVPVAFAAAHQVVACLLFGAAVGMIHSFISSPRAGRGPDVQMLRAYWEMGKPRIVFMVLVTTAIGYIMGCERDIQPMHLAFTLLGTAAAAIGSAVLNNYLERDVDALMARTRHRALPSGTIDPSHALAYGTVLVLAGVSLLVWRVNLLTGFLVLLTAFLYVLVYTPLKRISWVNTPIGAIPGALPPLNGWAAGAGELELGAWVLFAILFTWQHPHFYAIAWMCREDYASAGLKMLPVIDPSGDRTFFQTVLFLVLLIVMSAVPTAVGMTGAVYAVGVLLAGVMYLLPGLRVSRSRSNADARALLRASVLYLPVWLALIVIDVAV